MLNKLPLEIIVDISLHLTNRCKFLLMSICKRRKDVISQRTFSDTVKIFGGKGSTEVIEPRLCNETPLIFPNIERFKNFTCYDNAPRCEVAFASFIKWKNNLKRIDSPINGKFNPLYTLLKNNIFPCLTRLSLSLDQTLKVHRFIFKSNFCGSAVNLHFPNQIKAVEFRLQQNNPSLKNLTITWFGARLIEYQGNKVCSDLTRLDIGSITTPPNL
ncbi:hypothetical protein K501DRAFT_279470 [Backusella circina FSU 941]|nr:hypothetical protein K501DRAFT_279470 [Backusella circina FSU 941]